MEYLPGGDMMTLLIRYDTFSGLARMTWDLESLHYFNIF
jgi:hypothetical protein